MGLFNNANQNTEAVLDKVLYKVPGTDTTITWADAVEGILMIGATGSGKSSGPGKYTAMSMLKAGYGFCILCAKPDERSRWEAYAKAAGREKDLVIFNKESDLQFNFLRYDLEREGDGAGDIFNANNALMNISQLNRQINSSGGSNNEESFWDNALRRLIGNTISALLLAGEKVSIDNMRRVAAYSFKEKEDANFYAYLLRTASTQENIDPAKREEAIGELEEMIASNYFVKVIYKIQSTEFASEEQKYDATLVEDYWFTDFAELSDKTRSNITESLMGIIQPFLTRGILRSQFASGLDAELLPEKIIEEKKIVIIDFPAKEFGFAGTIASIIYKSIFQGAAERRKVENETNPIPACLWIDEYQNFCNPQTDAQFQTTARSSWISTVYITQNMNNLFFIMGNSQPQARAKSLVGNLNLKFFASNADFETNQWASDMIGKHFVGLDNLSISKEMELSKTKHQRLMPKITPDHFTTFKTGRKVNNYKVETVVFKAGKTWGKDKQNFAVVAFDQRK